MSVERAIVDANVLIYALDADAPQHKASRALLEEAQNDRGILLYVTAQILCEFYAIVTNPRRFKAPQNTADALTAISHMLGFLRVLSAPANVIDEVMALLHRHPVTGGDVFDLQIIATMKRNGIRRIYTFNTADFTPFAEIEVLTPERSALILILGTQFPHSGLDNLVDVGLCPTQAYGKFGGI